MSEQAPRKVSANVSNDAHAGDTPGLLLVTGGSRGIGAACAVAAAAAGWNLLIGYARRGDAADAVAAEVRRLGRQAWCVPVDVADERQVRAFFEAGAARVREAGPLRGVVHSAGIVAMQARLDEMHLERWQRMMSVNVTGSLLVAREAVRRISRRHGGPGGSLVLIGSAASRLGSPGMYVDYAASKGAVDTLVLGLAREVAAEGLRVNGVRPGIIATGIHADSGDAERPARLAASLPMQRAGQPEEVAAAVVWLLSDAASYTTGALLDVAGGR